MKEKQTVAGWILYSVILLIALVIHSVITVHTKMGMEASLLLLPVPFAWSGALTATLLLLGSILPSVRQRVVKSMPGIGAHILALTAGALLIEWLMLLSRSGGEPVLLEELLFPLFLFSGLLGISLFTLRKRRSRARVQYLFLFLALLIFVLPRESGAFQWNWYQSKTAISTTTQNSNRTNSTNWDGQSLVPGDHGATYIIHYSGVSGPVGKILSKRYGRVETFPENAAYVTISGTIHSPGVGALLPLLKWGSAEGRLVVNMHYLNSSGFSLDTEIQKGKALSFTASSIITFEVKQRLFGTCTVREYHRLMAKEIHKAVLEQVEKELYGK